MKVIAKDEPSGRLLDPGSDAGTRGMIAAARGSLCEWRAGTESGLYGSPAIFNRLQTSSNRYGSRDCPAAYL